MYSVAYADLGIVDLSKASTAEGRAELAVTVREALHNIGFFYLINHVSLVLPGAIPIFTVKC